MRVIAEERTALNRVKIIERPDPRTGRPMREMLLGEQHSSAMYLDGDDLAYRYTEVFALAQHFHPTAARALMIGGAGYSYPKEFLRQFPKAHMDTIELDPALTRLAKQYFNLPDSPRLHTFHGDGRAFIDTAQPADYDLLFGDAFGNDEEIPLSLLSHEAVLGMERILREHGVVMVNLIGSLRGSDSPLIWAVFATFKRVFVEVELIAVQHPDELQIRQNIVIVASHQPQAWQSGEEEFQRWLTHRYIGHIPSELPVISDSGGWK